jgi:hypothetical protein
MVELRTAGPPEILSCNPGGLLPVLLLNWNFRLEKKEVAPNIRKEKK